MKEVMANVLVTNAPRLLQKSSQRDPSEKTGRKWIAARACLNRQRFVNHGYPRSGATPGVPML